MNSELDKVVQLKKVGEGGRVRAGNLTMMEIIFPSWVARRLGQYRQ
jgi:hypothetical protein